MRLIQALNQIKSEKLISFHMPGHKNGRLLTDYPLSYDMDITEIPLADHLYEPVGCIKETQNSLCEWYQSQASYMIINGSTAGILAMIMGCVKRGERILINRNAHLSVYNALILGGIEPVYLYPHLNNVLNMPKGFDIDDLVTCLKDNKDIKACLLTYPTYDGICYDIKAFIDACHEYGVLVLVDEAHGAHLHLNKFGPKSALDLGADVVVHSFHKTLPAMTQTACLHLGKENLLTIEQVQRIEFHLRAVQTSSPSYVLMSSIDAMLDIIRSNGEKLTERLVHRIEQFFQDLSDLQTLSCKPLLDQEISKIIVSIDEKYFDFQRWSGHQLAEQLRQEHGIQVEYSSEKYILLMTSICNTQEDFWHLIKALKSIDQSRLKKCSKNSFQDGSYFFNNKIKRNIYDAVFLPFELIDTSKSHGRVAAEFVTPYPPGIPIVVPGEEINFETSIWLEKNYKKIKVLR